MQDMIENQQSKSTFYPTPEELAIQLFDMADFDNLKKAKYILEPSAGKGDLINWFKRYLYRKLLKKEPESENFFNKIRSSFDVDCIELDRNLRAILRDHKYKVVADDFLSYETFKRYDLIIYNKVLQDKEYYLESNTGIKALGEGECR